MSKATRRYRDCRRCLRDTAFGLACLVIVFTIPPSPLSGEEAILRASPEAKKWFEDARFGMFVHWGLYTLRDTAERHPRNFNPTEFDAREWVGMAKKAGIRYITITSKHHEGFCLFDSKLTDFDIVDATPFKRDVLKELADECHKQGIKLFFYYSQLDRHHPDYKPEDKEAWSRYKAYYIGQVRELCSNYGEIGGLWFDGWWANPKADWGHEELYNMIHTLQPNAMIGNNHHRQPFPGEDFQMFEQDLPGENTAGFNKAAVSDLPLETCRTINNHWGYDKDDHAHKSTEHLIRYLVQVVGRGGNLLLNTGPMPSGKILPEHVERYLGIGKWLDRNGEAIYGTRRGPYPPSAWGVSVRKGQNVYLHVLNWPGEALELPALGKDCRVKSARLLHDRRLKFTADENAIRISLPESAKNPVDVIVVLTVEGGLAANSESQQDLLPNDAIAPAATLRLTEAALPVNQPPKAFLRAPQGHGKRWSGPSG